MKFSVIVCTYNYAHLLPDALRSLAAQTFPYFELLIVDDGSTDNTEEVVRQFRNQFRQCHYLRKPHTGLADSRNFGIQAATGTHMAFLDADDLWAPNYLESVRRFFEGMPEAELVCCDGFVINHLGVVVRPVYPPGLPPVKGRIRTGRELFDFYRYSVPSMTSYKKSLYEQVGPYDARFPVAHDQHWVIRAVNQGAFCVRLDQKLFLGRQHGNNLTLATPVGRRLEEHLAIYVDALKTSPLYPELEIDARKLTRGWLRGVLAQQPPRESRKLLTRAIQAHQQDWMLKAAHLLTYFGLCSAAKWARRIKRTLWKPAVSGLTFDLQAPPEILFAAIAGQAGKEKAIGVGSSA